MFFNLKRISSSLLLRSFYLISIPIVLLQIIGIIVFFELHWDLVLKKMSNNIINNVGLFINEYDHYTEVPYGMLQTLELVLIKDDEAKIYKDSNVEYALSQGQLTFVQSFIIRKYAPILFEFYFDEKNFN